MEGTQTSRGYLIFGIRVADLMTNCVANFAKELIGPAIRTPNIVPMMKSSMHVA